jgi:hypothetical protein
LRSALGGQVGTPRHDVHLERAGDRRDLAADGSKAEQADGLSVQAAAEPDLPVAVAQRPLLGGDVSQQGEDQRPGELGGGSLVAAGAADRDAPRGGRGHVDRGVAHSRRDEEAQCGQPVEQLGGKRGAFPHRDHHVGAVEGRDELVGVVDGWSSVVISASRADQSALCRAAPW